MIGSVGPERAIGAPRQPENPGRSTDAVGHRAKAAVMAAREAGADLPKNAQGIAASGIARGADPASVLAALTAPPPADTPPDDIPPDAPPLADAPPPDAPPPTDAAPEAPPADAPPASEDAVPDQPVADGDAGAGAPAGGEAVVGVDAPDATDALFGDTGDGEQV